VKIQAIINGIVAYEESVTAYSVETISDLIADRYNIALLKKCGVEAYLVIVDVPSKMNSPLFKAASEAYDELYFKDTMM